MKTTFECLLGKLHHIDLRDQNLLKQAKGLLEQLPQDTSQEEQQTQGIEVAMELSKLKCDCPTLTAALLFPTFTNGKIPAERISAELNSTVKKLLLGTRSMSALDQFSIHTNHFSHQQNLIDNIRKMLLGMVDDIRIVLIKLVERLITLKHCRNVDPELQRSTAENVMALYAPLANRLGIGQLKWQIEDWAFRYLNPKAYKDLSKSLNMKRAEREVYVVSFIEVLKRLLQDEHIQRVEITGRAKHIYSIYKKIERKKVDFNEIYDAIAVRVLVPKIADCYRVLSLAHQEWHSIQKEFDDYIAKPKENGYRSIHTAVIGPHQLSVEIQIRTFDMHEESELGVAAHWRYKEGGQQQAKYQEKIKWLREVMLWQQDLSHDTESNNLLYNKIFEDRVYVFTPTNDVIDLTAGATPLDFAYYIHTQVGHRCRGAKVNGKIVPLTYILKTGDRVAILTHKNGTPSRDWLITRRGYIKTTQARSKIKAWFRQADFEKNLQLGVEIWDKYFSKNEYSKQQLNKITKQLNFKKLENLQASLGAGDIGITVIKNRLNALKQAASHEDPVIEPITSIKPTKQTHSYLNIAGVDNLLIQLARCCQPISGDSVLGYITKNSGISIHHAQCKNILHAQHHHPERIVPVDWGNEQLQQFVVTIKIECHERTGLIRDISNVIGNLKVAIMALTTHTNKLLDRSYIHASVEIENLNLLEMLIRKLKDIPDIITVKRKS